MQHTLWPLSLILLACKGPLPLEETGPLPSEAEPRSRMEGSPIVIADLAVGKEIEVEYHSQGCFHDERAKLTLARSSGGFQVSVRYKVADQGYAAPVSRRLTAEEVASLDAELGAVRALDHDGYCTTTTEYLVRGNGAELEKLVDGTCARFARTLDDGTMTHEPVVTFGKLVWEAAEPILLKERDASKGS